MDSFQFYSPTEFVFGKDAEQQIGALIQKHGGSRVLVHYGSGSAVRSGLMDVVKQQLEAAGLFNMLLGGVQPNPKDTKIREGIEICKSNNIDFILSVGGGSCIDSSKAIALGTLYDGDFWDFYGTGKKVERALPIGTVLTIAAAGSEGSGGSVVTKESTLEKRDVGSDLLRPRFSVLNPERMFTLPPYQTACGATDIMAHIFERYFTTTKEVEVTDRLCEALLLTMIRETPRVLKNPQDYDARANIMWAGTVAHNDIIGCGRAQDWNSHALEHELSGLYDVAHGAGLAVVMPAWMEYVVDTDVMRFAKVAVRVWGCQMNYDNPKETAIAGIHAFRSFLHSIGMPINFEELGAKESDIPYLVDKLGVENGVRNGFRPLNAQDVTNIYQIAAHASLE